MRQKRFTQQAGQSSFLVPPHCSPEEANRSGNYAHPVNAPDPRAIQSQPRALIVDDAPDITMMLAMILQLAGYDAVTAFSGAEALEAVQHEPFDVIVSDIGMPGMNGYELAQAVRALPGYSRVPLIAITGFTLHDNRTQALEAGFTHFLAKPIDPTTLLDLIARLQS